MRFVLSIILLVVLSCKEKNTALSTDQGIALMNQTVTYATGFSIKTYNGYKEIKLNNPWPDAQQELTYILYTAEAKKPKYSPNTTFIKVPVQRVIVTSTTDIPMLELLEKEQTLVGFPNTDYITSAKTRKLISNGSVKELGNERSINTELVLELAPDVVIGFSATGNTKAYDLIQKTGIPTVMNGSWMEKHPLGRAEWIKFVAAFYGEEQKARTIFGEIEKAYNNAVESAKKAATSPTVLAGSMFKDTWHVPGGDSYVAKFLKDANTSYLWADEKTTGSIALNFESVLEKGQNADFWIGSGSSKTMDELYQKNNRYQLFNAFKNKNVYSSTLKVGEKGGLLYYELGPMRPDLILKDIIKITHPEVLPDYELYFFKNLN
ncbi:ABC transporter substrate-binding protein [Aquimarina intermedia]|uniref:Iron complex transport system substrate-binding protein n=1 Tax=Aquimarina intermedia TaxID=350814 RepID=A0A5S5BXG9_9FLAO|nr:ABC transporter substrate-binding protein [Aquimarina intermedia]TYP71704.1 iron complex transport system substrate-binding protein [Aquimarina intermedia]